MNLNFFYLIGMIAAGIVLLFPAKFLLFAIVLPIAALFLIFGVVNDAFKKKLTILGFIGLVAIAGKLLGLINFSWFIILLPLYAPFLWIVIDFFIKRNTDKETIFCVEKFVSKKTGKKLPRTRKFMD